MTSCRVCDADTNAYLCKVCARELEKALAELPSDLVDLQAVATRQASGPLGLGVGHYGQRDDTDGPWLTIDAAADDPWVFAPAASDQLWVIGNTLSTWIRHLCESRGLQPPIAPRGLWITRRQLIVLRNRWGSRIWREFVPSADQPLADLAVWLVAHIDTIRHDEAAGEIHDEITGMQAENARWILGRPPADEFYGLCDLPDVRVEIDGGELRPVVSTCGAKIFGAIDAKRIDCPACGASYSRAERHESMVAELADSLGTIRQVAATLTKLGRAVTGKQIEGWLRRGLISDRGGHPRLVRVGDVLAQRAIVLGRATARRKRAA
jgi:hypothetical protein